MVLIYFFIVLFKAYLKHKNMFKKKHNVLFLKKKSINLYQPWYMYICIYVYVYV